VALFTGCIAAVVDRPVLEAAVKVLTHLGYAVDVPATQGCCGALHLHNGDPDGARRLARRALADFAGPWEAIVTTASGCGATLAEYPALEATAPAAALAQRVVDISDFLIRIPWPEDVVLRPLRARVAVHDPCSLANVLRRTQAPYTLLRRIPELEVVSLPGNPQCCGAAGAHLLTEPALGRALRADKIAALRALAPAFLASSNISCALHLAQGAREGKVVVTVIHPVVLLARQIEKSDESANQTG
jgi:glycolate oxidase iron-sulfur subunit